MSNTLKKQWKPGETEMPESAIVRAGLEFSAKPELQRKVFENIRAGVFDGARGQKILNSHFVMRSWLSLPFLFRQSIAAGKDAFRDSINKAVLAYNSDSALPDLVTRNFQSFRSFDNYDLRCFEAFRQMQFEPNRTKLEVPKVDGRVNFEQRWPSKRVELSEFSGAFQEFDAIEYGGGMQWSKSLLRNKQFNTLIELSSIFRDSAVAFQSEVVYQTLGGAAITNATTANIAGANAIESAIKTINKAAEDLAQDLKNEVGVDPAMAEFILYGSANDTRSAIIRAALAHVTNYNSAINEVITNRPIRFLPTYNLREADGTPYAAKYGVLCLAGRESVYGDKLMPTAYQGTDIYSFSDAQTVEMSFAVGLGNIKQARRVEIFAT